MDSAASEPEGTGGAPRISLGKGRALVPVPVPPRAEPFAGIGRSHGLVAAGVAVVMGLGFVAGTAVFASKPQTVVLAQAAPADPAADAVLRVQGEVRSLKASLDALRASVDDGHAAETVRALKRSVDALKGDLESAKAASASAVSQLGAKIDRPDRDPGPKLAEIAARLDKLDRDPSPKLAEMSARLDKLDRDSDARIAQVASLLGARLDRVERQVASADATGAIPQPTRVPAPRAAQPSPTGPAAVPVAAAPVARPEAPKAEPAKVDQSKAEPAPPRPDAPRQEAAASRPATLDGWLLRDVYDGVALVQGRAGGLREVSPGEYVPGVGEIRSIERRGRAWVVVTSRGLIQADNRW